ncbi:hypothetical protein S83_063923 [Arachis hypogaea]
MAVAPSIRLFPPSFASIPFPHRSSFSSRWRSPSSISLLLPIHSRLQSNIGAELPGDQEEIIFMGTGISEEIPRVSCLTNSLKKYPVCSKSAQPGNKNRRLNTSILIHHLGSSRTHNILIDTGK